MAYPYPCPPTFRGPRRTPRYPLPEDPVTCLLCGGRYWLISVHHLRLHDPALTLAEYKRLFPGEPTASGTLRAFRRDVQWDVRDGWLWTREEAIGVFKREWRRRGKQPSKEWWTKRGCRPGFSIVRTLFGSWNAFVSAAGGTPNPAHGLKGRSGRKPQNRCSKGHLIQERDGVRWCNECLLERKRKYRAQRRRAAGIPTLTELRRSQRTREWRLCPICGEEFVVPRGQQAPRIACSRPHITLARELGLEATVLQGGRARPGRAGVGAREGKIPD